MEMITVFILSAFLSVAPTERAGPVWVEREVYLMGTTLRARVAMESRAAALEATEAAFAEVRRLEAALSTWSPDSDVSRLNAAPAATAVEVSPELMALLAESAGWTRATGGAFDPAVGALVDAWDLRGAGRTPGPEELEAALRATGLHRVALDTTARRVTMPGGGAWLDTGGFGKGAALRAAGRVLRERGARAALLDFGGQVLAFGTPPEGGAWRVAVAHPARRGRAAHEVRLGEAASVSTSGQSERFVEVRGRRHGHVLDPRSGTPVPAWGSVTVVAADPLAADVLSTALLVMGPEEGRRWAARRDEGVLFLEVRDGAVVASWNEAFERYRPDHLTKQGS